MLAFDRELGNRVGIAASLLSLGRVSADEGDASGARALLLDSMARFRELGDEAGVAGCLEQLARVSVSLDEPERAVKLLASARVVHDRLGMARWPGEQRRHDLLVAKLRARLEAKRFAVLEREGSEANLDDAIAYASARARRQ